MTSIFINRAVTKPPYLFIAKDVHLPKLDRNGIMCDNIVSFFADWHNVFTVIPLFTNPFSFPKIENKKEPVVDKEENKKGWMQFISGLAILGGGLLMFVPVPGIQILGGALIGFGMASLASGDYFESQGMSYSQGWWLGGILGSISGGVIAWGSLGFSAVLSFGGTAMSTAGGLAIAGGVTVTGAQVMGAAAVLTGLVFMGNPNTPNPDDPSKPHKKGKKNWDKHTGPRSGGPEKKDARMRYKKGQTTKVIKSILFYIWARGVLEDLFN